jgi:hypothetical protein
LVASATASSSVPEYEKSEMAALEMGWANLAGWARRQKPALAIAAQPCIHGYSWLEKNGASRDAPFFFLPLSTSSPPSANGADRISGERWDR